MGENYDNEDNVNAKKFSEFHPYRFLEILNIKIVNTQFNNCQRIITCSDGNEYWLPKSQCEELDKLEKMGKRARIIHLNEMRQEYVKFNCTYYLNYNEFVEKNYCDIDSRLSLYIKNQPDILHPFSDVIKKGFVSKALSEYERYKHLNLIEVEIAFNLLQDKEKK